MLIRFYKETIHPFSISLENATRNHFSKFLHGTRYGCQRLTQATLRFLFISLPLHRIPLVKQLSKREINLFRRSIHVSQHVDKAVAAFSVGPKASFQLHPLDRRQMAKARQMREEWTAKNLSPLESEEEKRICRKQAQRFESLIELASAKRSTLMDFDREAWETYDALNFGMIQEHLLNLDSLFSSTAFVNDLASWGVDLAEAMLAEVLAKSLAYCQGLDGKEIHLPGRHGMESYVIREFHFGKALPGYILEPQSRYAHAWVIARGTQPMLKKDDIGELRKGARESIKADLHPDSITRDAVNSALRQNAVRTIFETRKVKFAGHSLGGALVSDLATRNPEKVAKIYTFSAPGMGRFEIERWNDTLEKALVAFDMQGDLVPCAGLYLKGLHIEIAQDQNRHPIAKHNAMALDKPFKASIVDNHRENARKSRHRMAALQRLQKRVIALHQQRMALLYRLPWR
ncbi:MAG: hypothetical protein LLG04_10240 [Parachlamydia sp.]|nr:hypothetical protein [Parachlamydia sp.]